jgi:hypothetical protein
MEAINTVGMTKTIFRGDFDLEILQKESVVYIDQNGKLREGFLVKESSAIGKAYNTERNGWAQTAELQNGDIVRRTPGDQWEFDVLVVYHP